MEKEPFHINPEKLPKHVAIIMDGNGRWAQKQGKIRTFGHFAGAETAKKIVEEARRTGIQYLTLYTFSTENWNRPPEEVETLMNLLSQKLDEERENLIQNQIRLAVVGDLSKLSVELQQKFKDLFEQTSKNHQMTLSLAVNYGGRDEIVQAVNHILNEKVNFAPGRKITEKQFEKYLYSADLPDVDLLIRTGGELRISNFLLWKMAYAELYFTDTYWPDFDENCFKKALADYQKRERRYGKTGEQIKNENK